jgi:hypothetical protein
MLLEQHRRPFSAHGLPFRRKHRQDVARDATQLIPAAEDRQRNVRRTRLPHRV